ncbi:uncharacterized mitochondrial protein AtMg00820-like [Impatiens glandulifera]|uniref:uncharacterized mitochondrial protein AtMg00820-like n=1 Tax=Impatiens glandulifera TaxID=253017 RepID=UPI001FB0DE85|nr:uncharacterized mitochondrial protein AtMg00820-like [Impatiens glandulifera]
MTTRALEKFGYSDLVALALLVVDEVHDSEPKSFKETMKSKERTKWKHVMAEEMASFDKNETWELVNKLKNQRVVGLKWVFKYKECVDGSNKPRFKVKLVAKEVKIL